MLVLKCVVFYIVLSAILYSLGKLGAYILKMPMNGFMRIMVDGFCLLLAIFQIIAYPIQVRKGSFYFLVGIVITGVVILAICAFIISYKRRNIFFY